jgi:hypothetical protein
MSRISSCSLSHQGKLPLFPGGRLVGGCLAVCHWSGSSSSKRSCFQPVAAVLEEPGQGRPVVDDVAAGLGELTGGRLLGQGRDQPAMERVQGVPGAVRGLRPALLVPPDGGGGGHGGPPEDAPAPGGLPCLSEVARRAEAHPTADGPPSGGTVGCQSPPLGCSPEQWLTGIQGPRSTGRWGRMGSGTPAGTRTGGTP